MNFRAIATFPNMLRNYAVYSDKAEGPAASICDECDASAGSDSLVETSYAAITTSPLT